MPDLADEWKDGCPLCEQRMDMHNGEQKMHGSWHLRREAACRPALHVVIESKPLGIALADEMPVNFCPVCGKEL